MRRLFLLLFLFVSPSFSQVVTFSPQGATALKELTGKRIKGVQVVGVTVCPGDGLSAAMLPSGRVYIAAVQGRFAPILPDIASTIVNKTVGGNWRNWVLEGFQVGSLTVAGLISGGVISASSRYIVMAVNFHSVIDLLIGKIKEKLPDPSTLTGKLLDPDGEMTLIDKCVSSKILSLYGDGFQKTAVRIDMGQPVGIGAPVRVVLPSPSVVAPVPVIVPVPTHKVVFDNTMYEYKEREKEKEKE